MNRDIARGVVLLKAWPDECQALFNLQQSPTKSIFDMPEVRLQFSNFLKSFEVDWTWLQIIDGKVAIKCVLKWNTLKVNFFLGVRLNEAKNEVQHLTEVLDVSALLASKGAEFSTFGMFELILTDLKKRKQHRKLFQIAKNLITSVERSDSSDEGEIPEN